MLSPEIVPEVYAVVGVAVLLLTVSSKSHRVMNAFAVALPAVYLALTPLILAFSALPAYSLNGGYFLVDHLSLYEILIAAALFLLAAVYSHQYIEGSIEMCEMDRGNLKLFYVRLTCCSW